MAKGLPSPRSRMVMPNGHPDTTWYGYFRQADRVIQGSREVLTEARTYYVDDGGSDGNRGLSADFPFQTVQKAVDVISSTLDLGGHDVTIQLAAGSYDGFIAQKCVGAGTVNILGDNANPDTRTFDGPPSDPIPPGGFTRQAMIWGFDTVTPYRFNGVRFNLDDHACLWALGQTTFLYGSVIFGLAGGEPHIRSYGGARVKAEEDYEIDGDAQRHLMADFGGRIETDGTSIILTGTPDFSNEYAIAMQVSIINTKNMTFTGSATGRRYKVETNGVIDTSGGGANYLPGDLAGTSATGGQYA